MNQPDALRASYDRVAGEYTRRIAGELAGKPLDRQLLDAFAARVRGRGPVCDLGCGPGHVTRYLHDEREVQAFGIDLSPGMVEEARRLNPGIAFEQGDMLNLDVDDAAWAAAIAFYSIINIPREAVGAALKEMHRVIRRGGLLFLAFHLGDEQVHLDEWWGHEVSVDFNFYRAGQVLELVQAAGFRVESTVERDPYEGVEHPSCRAYVMALKP
jgi:SAM-dependent methyltransferase